MSNNRDIMSYWPMPQFTPRKSQIEALEWTKQLPSDIKYILYEIPVGGGKSPLALNFSSWIANSLGDSFILTTQKILQKQYEDSFDKKMLTSVYGKSNYECASKNTNCDIGNDIKPPCESCPARSALSRGKRSPNMVLNYRLALLYFKMHDMIDIRKRDVMVFDECHTLEHHLTEFKAVSITMKKCKRVNIKYKECTKISEALPWLEQEYEPAVLELVNELFKQAEEISDKHYDHNAQLTSTDKHILREFKKWSEYHKTLKELLMTNYKDIYDQYVLVSDKTSFKFKELYGKNVFHELVKPMADKFLFMSSTILDKESFCKDLGIDPNEAAMISLPSEFDEDNRPVIYSPVTKMNYGWNSPERKSDRDSMAQRIMQICEEHADDHGIIHTGSFQVSDWLVEALQGLVPHRIFEHGPNSDMKRDDVIAEFMECAGKEPALLISPSITEGLDLVDDKGRFAIFAKIPYPFLGDQWIKKRMNLSNEWYQRQAMIAIIQGGGRVVRSKEDWGYTYILDSSFTYLHHNMRKKIPKWWSDGYIKV